MEQLRDPRRTDERPPTARGAPPPDRWSEPPPHTSKRFESASGAELSPRTDRIYAEAAERLDTWLTATATSALDAVGPRRHRGLSCTPYAKGTERDSPTRRTHSESGPTGRAPFTVVSPPSSSCRRKRWPRSRRGGIRGGDDARQVLTDAQAFRTCSYTVASADDFTADADYAILGCC